MESEKSKWKRFMEWVRKNSVSIILIVYSAIFIVILVILVYRGEMEQSEAVPYYMFGTSILIIMVASRVRNKKRISTLKDDLMKNHDEKMAIISRIDASQLNTEGIRQDIARLSDSAANKSDLLESINKKLEEQEKESRKIKQQIKEAATKQTSQKDIFAQMHENTKGIKAYFSISKSHAWLSFWLALINCLVGMVLLCLAVHYALTNPKLEPAIIAAITGAIAETFAGTSFVVHKKSLLQLNHYYNALHDNEMFLSTVKLIGDISMEKQDDIYIEVIRNEINVRYQNAIKPKKEKANKA